MLERTQLEQLKEPLSAIRPMKAVFDREYIRRIDGPNVKQAATKMEKAEMLMDDIVQFRKNSGAERLVMIWCASTEVFHRPGAVHQTLKDFECGLMAKNDPEIAPSQIYAYAALKSACSVRQWRSESDHRYTGAAGPGGAERNASHLRQRF